MNGGADSDTVDSDSVILFCFYAYFECLLKFKNMFLMFFLNLPVNVLNN